MLTPLFGEVLEYASMSSDFCRFQVPQKRNSLKKIVRCARHNDNNDRQESETPPGARPHAKLSGLPGVTAVGILTPC